MEGSLIRIAVDLFHRYLKATNGCKASIRPVIESDQIYGKQSVQLDWCVYVERWKFVYTFFSYVRFTTLQHRTCFSPPPPRSPNSYCWPAQLLRNNVSCPEYLFVYITHQVQVIENPPTYYSAVMYCLTFNHSLLMHPPSLLPWKNNKIFYWFISRIHTAGLFFVYYTRFWRKKRIG